jgi:3-dehydroquinate synthase
MSKCSKNSNAPFSVSDRLAVQTLSVAEPAAARLMPAYSCESVFHLRSNLDNGYHVLLAENLLEPDNMLLPDLIGARRALLVTTPTVERLYGEAANTLIARHDLNVETLVLPCDEQNKTLEMVDRVCSAALEAQLGRRDMLIALSGGVCSDITRVAASLIRRGISYVAIPTTLIGQIDAGIGIKGAVNFKGKKSYLGYFYPPKTVLLDPSFLRTLPRAHHRYGLAEIIKMAVISDYELFALVEQHAGTFISTAFQEPPAAARRTLWLSALRMLEQLEENPYENQTYKRLVDMGHTFSPALEAAFNFTIHHGEAVAIDVALSAAISHELGLMRETDLRRILSVIASAGLETFSAQLTCELCVQALEEVSLHRGGSINLVLPTEIGAATFLERFEELPRRVLEASLARLRRESLASPRRCV